MCDGVTLYLFAMARTTQDNTDLFKMLIIKIK